jgi:uncharacterized DUF497 family protein
VSQIQKVGDDYVYEHVDDEGHRTLFRWHVPKADRVRRERHIDLVEVASVFFDPLVLASVTDDDETRGVLTGFSKKSRVLVVVRAEIVAKGTFRVVTAWKASREERRAYEEGGRPRGGGQHQRDAARNVTFLEFFRLHHPTYRRSAGHVARTRGISRKAPRSPGDVLARNIDRMIARQNALRLIYRKATAGRRLLALRTFQHVARAELARRTGFSPAKLQRIESDQIPLTLRDGRVVAHALRIPVPGLMWGRG